MKISFNHIASNLGTRFLAQGVREKIETAFRANEFVEFDFTDVSTVSHSFADECFGKLLLNWEMSEIKSLSTFIGANQTISSVISFCIKERLKSIPEVA